MINICIPETRWTKRIWLYVGLRKTAILGRQVWLEFIENEPRQAP